MQILACGVFIKTQQKIFCNSKQGKSPTRSGKYEEKIFKILLEAEYMEVFQYKSKIFVM